MMKKLFQGIGMISLICFSFFYTEKAALVVKETDDLLITIRDSADQYQVEAVNAEIDGNTIIPGINGKEVDVEKSYEKMKHYGKFQEKLLEYKDIEPKERLSRHFDKYVIGGNKEKNQVSLLFLVDEKDSVDSVLSILDQFHLKGNFFVDGLWFEDHNDEVTELIQAGHVIGNLSYQGNYQDSSFIWMDTIIKKIAKQRISYCYTEEENEDTLEICSMNHDYTIMPSYVVQNYPLKEIKQALEAGSIISLSINDTMIQELPVVIRYIQSKGYTISTLSDHLHE